MSKNILYRIFVVSIIFLASLSPLTITEVKAQEDTWTTLAPMQEARYGLGVVAENGKIYAMGGYPGAGSYSDSNEEYDPKTDTWTKKASMPEPMAYFGITVYHGKIYCFSGETGSTFVYTPLYDTWETKAPIPNPREGILANTVDSKIYVFGGESNSTDVYDPINDSWANMAPLNGGLSMLHGASVVLDGLIHVFGAVPREFSHQIFDPKADVWSLGEPLIERYYFTTACVTTGVNSPKRIYVFGADNRLWTLYTPISTSQSYDPKTGNWSLIDTIPSSHFMGGATTIDDNLYIVGGATAGYTLVFYANSQSRLFTPINFGTPDPSYTSPPSTPTPTAPPEPESFPTTFVIASVAVIAVVGLGIFAYFKKRRS